MMVATPLALALLLLGGCQATDAIDVQASEAGAALVPEESAFAAVLETPTADLNIRIELKNSFIEQIRDRATMDAAFIIDRAHKRPNPPSKDGDMHVAGRSADVELPIVAELMNGRFEKAAVKKIHEAEGTGSAIPITGVWRIWCEHAGNSTQIQGDTVPVIGGTNPDHVFEFHPLTNVDGLDVLRTLRPIAGYETKDARRAFERFEDTPCQIIPGADSTTILTKGVGYNYPEFIIRPVEDGNGQFQKFDMDDGSFVVVCNVHDVDGDLLIRNHRMVFVKDSLPAMTMLEILAGEWDGDAMHVLGIPRISLHYVKWRVDHKNDPREPLRWNLPYEVVIVGVYDVYQLAAMFTLQGRPYLRAA